jgi:cardiolipin synthase
MARGVAGTVSRRTVSRRNVGRRKVSRRRISLRPREGRRLPPELRPEQVTRRAETIVGGVRGPELPALLSEIDDQAPIHPHDRVTVYVEGSTAFEAMHQAIETAREEVLLESYIVRDDTTGRYLAEALEAAAGRGARVRVLADAWGSLGTGGGLWNQLLAAGAEVRFYHSLLRQPWYHPYRDHRKILTVDRTTAFTGGMNIGDEYGPPSGSPSAFRTARGADAKRTDRRPPRAWRDTHCRVVGSTAREMAAVFAEGWGRSGGEEFGVTMEPDRGTGAARILVLDSRPGRGHDEAASVLAALTGAARETLWITNAYLAPGRQAIDVLCRAAARGVDVRLLLPGLTDVPIVRHAGHGWYRRLLEGGVRIWEYRRAVLHAKSLVADGYASVIGSTNLDFRSFRLNAECNLVIQDESTGAALTEAFERDLEHSGEIELATWRRRPLLHRAGDRLARWLAPLL